nr:MAG TPA: Preprotein translocase subunit secY, Preprotein Transport, Membrane Protein Complex.9A [Caudoviricetes sp.]
MNQNLKNFLSTSKRYSTLCSTPSLAETKHIRS